MCDDRITQQQRDDLDVMRGAFGLPLAMLTQDEKLAFDRLFECGLAKAERVVTSY